MRYSKYTLPVCPYKAHIRQYRAHMGPFYDLETLAWIKMDQNGQKINTSINENQFQFLDDLQKFSRNDSHCDT